MNKNTDMNTNINISEYTATMPITMEEAGCLIREQMANNDGKISPEIVDAFLRATLPVGTPDIMIELTPNAEDVITTEQREHINSIIDEYGTQDSRMFKLIRYIYEQGYTISLAWKDVCCVVTLHHNEEEDNE